METPPYDKYGWKHTVGQPRPDTIVCAAMLMEDDEIVTGIRHFSPDMRNTLFRLYGKDYHKKVKEQGFVTQYGEFVSRERAAEIVKTNRQKLMPREIKTTIYSEDLY